jgi:hypothetical protein
MAALIATDAVLWELIADHLDPRLQKCCLKHASHEHRPIPDEAATMA